MLAPRKKLWSSPPEVLSTALDLLKPQQNDIVYDIGCGNGNFVVHCATQTIANRIIGVEIEESTIQTAREAVSSASEANQDLNIQSRVELIHGNALEVDYSGGACFFCYLIPRGLKIILPILQAVSKDHPIRVVTYMSPFECEGLTPVQVVKVSTEKHPDAQWPLFYYEFDNTFSDTQKDSNNLNP